MIEQIENLKLIYNTTTRVFIQWDYTEEGRDKNDCYERIDLAGTIIYQNAYSRKYPIFPDNPFWEKLEKLYNLANNDLE